MLHLALYQNFVGLYKLLLLNWGSFLLFLLLLLGDGFLLFLNDPIHLFQLAVILRDVR